MTYILIYLLVGMIIAGLGFRKLYASFLTKEEIQEIKSKESSELSTELASKMIIGFVLTFVISVLTVFFFPAVIAIRMTKKVYG